MEKLGKLIFYSFFIAVLSGCATYNPVPDGYKGEKATITDSFLIHSNRKVDFFYLAEVDGHPINNSLFETRRRNFGGGFSMTPVFVEREVPATTTRLKIVGRTDYAAPILSLMNTVYRVQGEIDATLEANTSYVVRGELAEDHSVVWLESVKTGQVLGKKIEINGSSALGILEK